MKPKATYHPTPTLIAFASTLPLKGRVRAARISIFIFQRADTRLHSRDAHRVRVLRHHCPPKNRGRRESRVLVAPAASRAMKKAHELVTTGSTEQSGFPRAMVLRLIPRSPRGPGFLAPVALRSSKNLVPASGHQDHTTSPSAMVAARLAASLRPSHPALNVRDDREAPLLVRRDGRIEATDLPDATSTIFFA